MIICGADGTFTLPMTELKLPLLSHCTVNDESIAMVLGDGEEERNILCKVRELTGAKAKTETV